MAKFCYIYSSESFGGLIGQRIQFNDTINQVWRAGGGFLNFGFGRDVPSGILKVDSDKYQFLKKKWPIHIPIEPLLGQILTKITQFFSNFLKFEPILAKIWENFDKITHSNIKFCIK